MGGIPGWHSRFFKLPAAEILETSRAPQVEDFLKGIRPPGGDFFGGKGSSSSERDDCGHLAFKPANLEKTIHPLFYRRVGNARRVRMCVAEHCTST